MKSIVDTEIPKKISMILKTLRNGESIDIIYRSRIIGIFKPVDPPIPLAMTYFGKTKIVNTIGK